MAESSRPTIVSLASSLLADLRRLMSQEVQLAKHEMQHEVSKVVKATILASMATILSLIAVILLSLTLVYVLHSLLGVSLWASYGVVGRRGRVGLFGLENHEESTTLALPHRSHAERRRAMDERAGALPEKHKHPDMDSGLVVTPG